MTILLLKGYNNYFNRIRKYEASITDYKTASTSYLEYPNVNFDMQDGIMTSLVVGSEVQQREIPPATEGADPTNEVLRFDDLGCPDYLIVHDNVTINSRWFIVESVKIRKGQYKLALKRDVLVDFNAQIMDSPCFVEKGFINDINDPLLLNPEGFKGNQIKTSEVLLRDLTHCAWLTGYIKKNLTAKSVSYTIPSEELPSIDSQPWANCVEYIAADNTSTQATKKYFAIDRTQSTMKFRVYYTGNGYSNTYTDQNIRLTFSYDNNLVSNNYTAGHSDWEGLNSCALDVESHGLGFFDRNSITSIEAQNIGNDLFDHTINWNYITPYYNNVWASAKNTKFPGSGWVEATTNPMSLAGQRFKHDNKVYTLAVSQVSINDEQGIQYFTGNDSIAVSYLSQLYYSPKEHWFVAYNQDNPSKQKVKVQFKGTIYTIQAYEQYTDKTISFTLPASSDRTQCNDALYDMFTIPIDPYVLGIVRPENAVNDQVHISHLRVPGSSDPGFFINLGTSSETQLKIATMLCTALGAGASTGAEIYDLQVLPYCPIPKLLDGVYQTRTSSGSLMFTVINPVAANLSIKDYSFIMDNSDTPKKIGIVFYPEKANITIPIDLSDVDKNLLANNAIRTDGQTIKDPIFTYSGSDEDGYYWYWTSFPYKPSVPDTEISSDDLVIDIEDYDPDDYAYGGWMTAGTGLYYGIPVDSVDSPTATMSFTGTVTLKAPYYSPYNAMDKKIANECDIFRLTSPNYNGMFEFKKVKLDGGIQKIDADITMKPFTPYIKVNPNLQGSYYATQDYEDSTGLICGGDFSLPMLSDAFTNYALNNKNYQNAFDRQIQNLDVNARISREQLDFQGLMGTIMGGFTGSAAGLSAGMKTGNPYVAAGMAVAGGIAGNVLPAVGWQKDKDWLQAQMTEARDFKTDMFNYQLGNVQALPQSVTKSSPLSYNNKIWPILEYYTCKDKEKDLLRNKIKYNGMTIMAIGALKDYATTNGFLKGQMIRLENLDDDSHVAQAIYEEVNKGFYEGE